VDCQTFDRSTSFASPPADVGIPPLREKIENGSLLPFGIALRESQANSTIDAHLLKTPTEWMPN
jgi:hypothetical protein